jgi:hypothetical protein
MLRGARLDGQKERRQEKEEGQEKEKEAFGQQQQFKQLKFRRLS